ncbi:MAG: SOS response-associated peptidase [Leptolyngbya sp. SIO1D8]|nr:SOS response-associated peptidase [Leptolyngbya sp. SIO1D8]
MCGRFSQTQSGEEIASAFQLDIAPQIKLRYNIAPTQAVSVITQSHRTQKRVHHQKYWGLVPSWAKDSRIGQRLINARSETVAEKPAFRSAFQRRRCLVIADGFYEWQRVSSAEMNALKTDQPQKSSKNTTKQPFLIQLKTKTLFAFAGLWERWQDPDTHQSFFSCTILTTQPNDLMAPIHGRMPVILAPENYHVWLDPSFYTPGLLKTLLRPYEASAMMAKPISTAINNPRNDSAKVQESNSSETL